MVTIGQQCTIGGIARKCPDGNVTKVQGSTWNVGTPGKARHIGDFLHPSRANGFDSNILSLGGNWLSTIAKCGSTKQNGVGCHPIQDRSIYALSTHVAAAVEPYIRDRHLICSESTSFVRADEGRGSQGLDTVDSLDKNGALRHVTSSQREQRCDSRWQTLRSIGDYDD